MNKVTDLNNPNEKVPGMRGKLNNSDIPKKPSIAYRIYISPTKSPYDFKKAKKRRKIAKASR